MPSREEYRRLVESWVEGAQESITGADMLYEALRDTPYYAPRAIVREVWEETMRASSYVPLIQRLDPEESIPRSWVHSTDWQYSQPFAVQVEIAGTDTVTQAGLSQHITLLYDNMPTLGLIEEDAYTAIAEEITVPMMSMPTVSLSRISHVFGARWSTP